MKKLNFLFASLAIALVVALYCYAGSSKNNVSLLSENVEALAGWEDQLLRGNDQKEKDCDFKGWLYNEALKHSTSVYTAKGKEFEASVGAGWAGVNGSIGGKYKEADKVVIVSSYDCKPSSGNCCDPSAQRTEVIKD